jgi:glutaconate CoA-transferase subunit B
VRLPGAGGAPEIAASCREVLIVMRQSRRSFVEKVDFVTSVGFGADGRGREGVVGAGPTAVITDLGILQPDAETHELTLTHLHPGISFDDAKDATGWDLRRADTVETTAPPTAAELDALHDLLHVAAGQAAGVA